MNWNRWPSGLALYCLMSILLIGCTTGSGRDAGVQLAEEPANAAHVDDHEQEDAPDHVHESDLLYLPPLEPADLSDGRLRVVATTSIIGDVVAQVGGEAIALTTLMKPGQDPHSFEPSAQDLTAVAEADLIFVNGWDLEEGLLDTLASIAGDTPMVAVSARLEPREFEPIQNEEDGHAHASPDPHTWLDPHNVIQWVANIKIVLSDLDPANAEIYDRRADTYKKQLQELITYYDEQIAAIPENSRKIVTNHNAFGYFADRYGFKIVGTVLPSFSTLAEPSASELAALVQTMAAEDVCTIFIETTANDQLAQAAAAELENCPTVQVLTLYSGALGPAGSGAENYIAMMRTNIDTIINGLQE